jgi:hypothetical protein
MSRFSKQDWIVKEINVLDIFLKEGIVPYGSSYSLIQLSQQCDTIDVKVLKGEKKVLGIFTRKVYEYLDKKIDFIEMECGKELIYRSYGVIVERKEMDYTLAYHVDDKNKKVYWKVTNVGKPRDLSCY